MKNDFWCKSRVSLPDVLFIVPAHIYVFVHISHCRAEKNETKTKILR